MSYGACSARTGSCARSARFQKRPRYGLPGRPTRCRGDLRAREGERGRTPGGDDVPGAGGHEQRSLRVLAARVVLTNRKLPLCAVRRGAGGAAVRADERGGAVARPNGGRRADPERGVRALRRALGLHAAFLPAVERPIRYLRESFFYSSTVVRSRTTRISTRRPRPSWSGPRTSGGTARPENAPWIASSATRAARWDRVGQAPVSPPRRHAGNASPAGRCLGPQPEPG